MFYIDSICAGMLIVSLCRGDTAFCSLECRQHQMNQDERNEKCSLLSVKKEGSSTAGSESSSKGG